jgi:hypothetical protein
MKLAPRLAFSLLAALSGATVGFFAPFLLVAGLAKCPPAVRTCDLPAIAGVGLGLLAAPLIAFGGGLVTFWWLGRSRPDRSAA